MELLNQLLKNPEMAGALIPTLVEKYKEPLYVVGKELLKIYSDLVNNDEFYKLFALNKKHAFDAYVEVGFTEE